MASIFPAPTPGPKQGSVADALNLFGQTGSVLGGISAFDPPTAEEINRGTLTPAQKKAQDIAQIKNATRDADSVALFELQRKDPSFDNQVAKDYVNMSGSEFRQTYGDAIYETMIGLAVGGRGVNQRAGRSRTIVEDLQDIGVQFLSGGSQLAGGLGFVTNKFVLGNDELAVQAAQAGQAGSEWVHKNLGSSAGEDLRHVAELRTARDILEQKASYARSAATEGSTVAGLRDLGSGTVNAVKRYWADPSQIAGSIVESAPSFVFGGPISKGASIAAKTALGVERLAGTAAVPGVSSAARVAGAIDDAAFNLTVGALEAGGAASGAVNTIMSTPAEQLMEQSPEYKSLIEAGVSDQVARTRLAAQAGATAAPWGFVGGAATAGLVKGFETNLGKTIAGRTVAGAAPTLKSTVEQTGKNIFLETTEEAAQGITGQVAQNVGTATVNPDQPLLEGVGSAMVESAIAGAGTAAAVGAPSIALQGTKAAVTVPLAYAGGKLVERGERRAAKIAAESPTSTETLTPEVEAAAAGASDLAESLRTLASEEASVPPPLAEEAGEAGEAEEAEEFSITSSVTTDPALVLQREFLKSKGLTLRQAREVSGEAKTALHDEFRAWKAARAAEPTEEAAEGDTSVDIIEEQDAFIRQVEKGATLDVEELRNLPGAVAQKIRGLAEATGRVPTRFEAMIEVAKIIDDETTSPDDKMAAAIFVGGTVNNTEKLFGEESQLPAFLENAAADHPTRQKFDSYRKTLSKMGQNPTVKMAMDWLNRAPSIPDQDLSEVDLHSPEGQQVIQNTVNVATHAPHKASEKNINQLLQADEEGTADLTTPQRQVLRGTQSMLAAESMFKSSLGSRAMDEDIPGGDEGVEENVGAENISLINRQVNQDGGPRAHQKSIQQHVTEINAAIMSGDVKALTKGISNLSMFALSQRNKVQAIQDSIDDKGDEKGRVSYEAFDGKGMQPADGTFTTFFNKKAMNSVKFAQTVHGEANALTQLANDFIRQHPETGLTPFEGEITLNLPKVAAQQDRGTPPGGLPDLTNVATTELHKRLEFFTKQRAKGTLSPEAEANEKHIQAELKKREPGTKSRITPEEAAKLSDAILVERIMEIERLNVDDKATPEDFATLEVLSNEQTRRNPTLLDELKKIAREAKKVREAAAKLKDDELEQRIKALEEQENPSATALANLAIYKAELAKRKSDPALKRQELITAIQRAGDLSTAQLHKLNAELAKLTDEEFSKLYIEAYNNHPVGDGQTIAFTEPTGKALRAIQDLFTELSGNLGWDTSAFPKFVRMVIGITWQGGGRENHGGEFNSVGPSIFIADKYFYEIEDGTRPPAVIGRIVLHEFAHAIDFHGGDPDSPHTDHLFSSGTYVPSTVPNNPDKDDSHWVSDFNRDGALWKEFQGLRDHPKIPSITAEPLWDYVERQDERLFNGEFFAELGAFALAHPDLARELIPEGFKAFEAVLKQAAANRQLPEPKLGNPKSSDEGVPTKINVWYGSGENIQFSNLFLRPFTYKGRKFINVEHAYQSLKSGKFSLKTYEKYQQGKAGVKYAGTEEAKTEDGYNIKLMQQLMQASFDQNPIEMNALIATGNAIFTHTQDKGIWATEFPRILMEIREGAKEAPPVELLATLNETLEVTKPPEPNIKAAFPNLVQQAKNWFHKALRVPKKVKSRLSLLANPMTAVSDLLDPNNPQALKEFMEGAKIKGYDVNTEQLLSYQQLLAKGQKGLEHVQARLKQALTKQREGRTLLERLKAEDPEAVRTRDNRILNILEPDGDTFKYNSQLMESAMLAALDWVMNMSDRQVPLSLKDVAEIMGTDEATAYQYMAAFENGVPRETAVRALTENIRKFWGLDTNRDTNMDFTTGIPEAVAKEMLLALENMKLLKLGSIEHKVERMVYNEQIGMSELRNMTEKEVGRVWFDKRPHDLKQLLRSLNRTHNLLRDIALVDPPKEGYSIGVPITDIDETQLRQGMVTLTPQNKIAQSNAQQVPYFLDRIQLGLIQSMGLERFVSLMSKFPYKEGDLNKTYLQMGYNKNDWESVKGRQRGLVATYEAIEKQVAAMQAYVDNHNANNPDKQITIDQVPIYYKHHVNRLGRNQMDGTHNPQSDKTARHLFVSTKATMDLSKPDTKQFQNFLKTIAQGLGIKTEKLFGADAAAKVLHWVIEKPGPKEQGKFNEAFLGLKAWLKTNQKTIPEDTYKLLQAAGLTEHGLHALMAYARYDNAREAGEDLTKFEHWNPLEADGKTNGVINALMMAVGPIVPEWLETMAKGGVFFGRLNKTLNQHYLEDPSDIYQTDADKATRNAEKISRELAAQKDQAAYQQGEALRRVMGALYEGISFDAEGGLVIGRSVTKDPQMQSVYSAGADSMSKGITHVLVQALYAKMSEAARNNQRAGETIYAKGGHVQFMDDLYTLLSNKPVFSERLDEWVLEDSRTTVNFRPLEFTISPKQFETLTENVKMYLVNPMVEAINDTVNDHVKEVTGTIQQATQVQSIFLVNMMIQEVVKGMLEKQTDAEKHDWHAGEISLSENDMERIRKTLLIFSPFIDTGTQRYMLSGGQTTELFPSMTFEVNGKTIKVNIPTGYSAGVLNTELKTAIYIYGAVYAGVRSIPVLNVGSGDGQMVMNILANHPEEVKRMLHVFDGMYMPADKIEEFSRLINGEVFNTWTKNENPIRAVAASYEAFMKADPIGKLFPGSVRNKVQQEALVEITKVGLGQKKPKKKDIYSSADARIFMEGLVDTLHNLADELDARRQVYREFRSSIDHMSSGEAPHVNEGIWELDPDISMGDLALLMQERMEEVLLDIQKHGNRGEYKGDAPPPSRRLRRRRVDPVQEFTPDQLKSRYKKNPLMVAAINAVAGKGYRIVFGTPDQLDKWEAANNPRYQPGSNQGARGKIDPVSKIITISTLEDETVLHELLHAATIDKVTARYTDPKSLSVADREAVDRIIQLMNEWVDLGSPDDILELSTSRALAYNAIRAHQWEAREAEARGDKQRAALHKAAALNEFMAWVLSNQELAAEAAKTKVQNPVAKILGNALKALKTLIWGSLKAAPTAAPNLMAQLRFNTHVLMATPTTLEQMQATANQVMLYQSASFGNNERLSIFREGFNQKIIAWLNEPYIGPLPRGGTQAHRDQETIDQQKRRGSEFLGAKLVANDFVKEFAKHFDDLNDMQAWSTFEMMQTALFVDVKLNPNVMSRLEELYDHVISKLERDNFKLNNDPNDPEDNQKAQDKFEALHGLKAFHTDSYGRSSFLSSFLALAVTSDEFRNILSKMEKPEVAKNTEGGMNALVDNFSAQSLNWVSQKLSGEKANSRTITEALDDLTVKLIEQVADQQKLIDMQAENQVSKMDRAIAEGVQNLSGKIYDKSEEIIATSGSKLKKGAAYVARAAATVVNQEAADRGMGFLTERLNRVEGWNETRALLNEFIGRTKDNANIWDLISKVRAFAQQTRQRYRDQLPKELAKQFTRPLKAEENTAMTRILAKSDIMAMLETHGTDGVLQLSTDTQALNTEIRAVEKTIRGYEGTRAAKVFLKANELAEYMMTRKSGPQTLTNAHAVARLFGDPRDYQQTLTNEQLVKDVDKLVTLYALRDHTSQADKTILQELINTESAGVKFTLNYLNSLRKAELAKATSGGRMALPNYIKGYLPSIQENQGHMVLADKADHAEWTRRGYAKVDDYEGSSADRALRGGKNYYFSPVSSKMPFRQGIMQTVRYTTSGIDPQTGYLSDELIAGRITKRAVVDLIHGQLARQRPTTENLRPIFDDQTGETVAYERLVDPMKLVGLNNSTHLLKLMGAWKGRQIEESFAPALNEKLIDELKATWDKADTPAKKREFVNVLATDDPVLKDAVKLIPNYSRDYAEEVFGKDILMVRRDMELQTLGDRQASLGDMFTGQTRWSQTTQERFEKMAMGLFATRPFVKLLGEDQALPSIIKLEGRIQDFVVHAKDTIVIRSVVVPVANIMANFGQLINRGVPVRYIISQFPKKVLEINTYIKARNKEIQLEAELEAAKGENKLNDIRKLESRIQALHDSYKRLSIWPLIEGGQFASISDGKVTAEDLALGENRWSQFIENQLNKIPNDGIKTAAKYGMVTRDTAAFQILAASVQYGDFVAKAILYDHLVATGTSQTEAIAEVSEAFINYNVLSGRSRDWLERHGLLWFYSYKLRAIKEAAWTLRNRPLRSLLMMTMPGLSAFQSAIDSNFVTLAVEGDLPWSIGPGMGLNSYAMNPVVNLMGLD